MDILSQTLNITWVGIALVFAGILVLWGMMALLVHVFREKLPIKPAQTNSVVNTSSEEQRKKAALAAVAVALAGIDLKPRAAAAAVATALRIGESGFSLSAAAPQSVSSWQIANRIVQLNLRNQTFTRKPRGK